MKLFKKYISKVLFIIISSCLLSFNVDAITFGRLYDEAGNILCLYNIQDNEVTITSAGQLNNVIIPDYIEGYPVTKIGKWAMCMNDNYTSVTLPQTLLTIEDEAIISCENIKEITIPKSVQNIGEHAWGYILTDCSDPKYMPYLKYVQYGLTIKGYNGTAAETYAKENGFKFVYLDDEPQVTTATTITTQTTTTSTTVSTTTTSKATTETTKATTSATTITTNSTTTSLTTTSVSASMSNSSTSDSTAMTTSQTTAATTTITTTTNVKGDANGDNKLDVRDAAFIAQKIALDKASELPKCADFNDDGTVNVRDAATIARYLASNVKK